MSRPLRTSENTCSRVEVGVVGLFMDGNRGFINCRYRAGANAGGGLFFCSMLLSNYRGMERNIEYSFSMQQP